MNLDFYTRPFRADKHSGWVRDAKDNFVFQFESEFDDKGNYVPESLELEKQIIFSLNALDQEPIRDINLSVKHLIDVFSNDRHIITIRGWGNLTGIGGHNLSSKRAVEIQDNFVKYLIYKLTSDETI